MCLNAPAQFTNASVIDAGSMTYSWDFNDSAESTDADPVHSFSSVSSYNVALIATSDLTACTDTIAKTITVNNIVTSTTSSNVTTAGGSDGSATVNVTSGKAPYSYSWSVGGTGKSVSGLSVGTHYVDVTDANGCSTQDSVVIIEAEFYINAVLLQNVLCNGANDGAVSFSAINGTPPYTYDIDGDSIYTDSPVLTALAPGTYTVSVKDAIEEYKDTTFTITEPSLFAVTAIANNMTCNGVCDGSLSATVIGGSAPYTYAWDNEAGNASSSSGLCANTYALAVTDSNGCSAFDTVIITEPAPLSETTQNITACDSAEINGVVYTSSQLVIDTLMNVTGCDSIVKTNLTINSTSSS